MNESITMLRPAEAAEALRTSTGRLANLRSAGRGPAYVKMGSAIRYPVDSLVEYLARNRVDTLDSLAGAE